MYFLSFFLVFIIFSCANFGKNREIFLLDEYGSLLSGGKNPLISPKEISQKITINEYFTLDKNTENYSYRFDAAKWFCDFKSSQKNFAKHAAGFPLNLELDGNKSFAYLIPNLKEFRSKDFKNEVGMSNLPQNIDFSNPVRELSQLVVVWEKLGFFISDMGKFFKDFLGLLQINSSNNQGENYFLKHPVFAFLPVENLGLVLPGLLIHFYQYGRDYQYSYRDSIRTFKNYFTSVFIEIFPDRLYSQINFAEEKKIYFGLNLVLVDLSNTYRTFNVKKSHSMVNSKKNKSFSEDSILHKGIRFPLIIEIVLPSHNNKNICSPSH